MLETTQYNYKELSKMYKEQTQTNKSQTKVAEIKEEKSAGRPEKPDD